MLKEKLTLAVFVLRLLDDSSQAWSSGTKGALLQTISEEDYEILQHPTPKQKTVKANSPSSTPTLAIFLPEILYKRPHDPEMDKLDRQYEELIARWEVIRKEWHASIGRSVTKKSEHSINSPTSAASFLKKLNPKNHGASMSSHDRQQESLARFMSNWASSSQQSDTSQPADSQLLIRRPKTNPFKPSNSSDLSKSVGSTSPIIRMKFVPSALDEEDEVYIFIRSVSELNQSDKSLHSV